MAPLAASTSVELDFDRCYRSVTSRDPRFDGWFFTAVTSTGIYCRPSCPALTPKRSNVRFFPSAAAAQRHGFRACKRCQPDATPGSPRWNGRADVVSRAMRLILDGVVDREGVTGLANRLGYTPRHLRRLLVAEVGAGPLGLARAQRAQTARILIQTTDLPFSRVAFAAGFSSIRQFNDTIQAVFATTPMALRQGRLQEPSSRMGAPATTQDVPGGQAATLTLRLAYRQPCDIPSTIAFLAARAVHGVEEVRGDTYRRSLRLPHGSGIAELTPFPGGAGHVRCVLRLTDLRDVQAAVSRCRLLLDLDADPLAVREVLVRDVLSGAVRARPGLRLIGSVDGAETAVRVVLGQQISVQGARTMAGRLVSDYGSPLPLPDSSLTHLFPTVESLADANPDGWPLPATRRAALHTLCSQLSDDATLIDGGSDPEALSALLGRIRGIGPWTASLIRMRALGDPDVFLPTDRGVRRGLERLGVGDDRVSLARQSDAWRPWRSYAVHHLWALDSEFAARSGPFRPSRPARPPLLKGAPS